jgi:hypothetical protein
MGKKIACSLSLYYLDIQHHYFSQEFSIFLDVNKCSLLMQTSFGKNKTNICWIGVGTFLNIHPTPPPPPLFLSIKNNAIFEILFKLDLPCSWLIS